MRMETNTTFGSFTSATPRCFNFHFTGYFHSLVCHVVKKTSEANPNETQTGSSSRTPPWHLWRRRALSTGSQPPPVLLSPRPVHLWRPKPLLPRASERRGGLSAGPGKGGGRPWGGVAAPVLRGGQGSGRTRARQRPRQCPCRSRRAPRAARAVPGLAAGRGGGGEGRAGGTSPLGGRQ